MTRLFEMDLTPEVVRYPGQLAVALTVRREDLVTACLAVCLLQEDLLLKAVFKPLRGQLKMSMERPKSQGGFVLATLTETECRIGFTRDSLEYLQHFLLRYYRDGVADVDHIDIQAHSSEGDEVHITFKVNESGGPMTPEQAEKWLLD